MVEFWPVCGVLALVFVALGLAVFLLGALVVSGDEAARERREATLTGLGWGRWPYEINEEMDDVD